MIQKTLQSRITLLRGFSSVFRSPFSNIFQGLKLLVKDLKDTTTDLNGISNGPKPYPDEWQETVNNVLKAWRNTLDIFDDMLICEIFEDKAIKLEPETILVLPFVQDTATQLLSQVSSILYPLILNFHLYFV